MVRQRVEVELISLVDPYASSIGHQLPGLLAAARAERAGASFFDQSLRSIALACRTRISGVVGRLLQVLLDQEVVVRVS